MIQVLSFVFLALILESLVTIDLFLYSSQFREKAEVFLRTMFVFSPFFTDTAILAGEFEMGMALTTGIAESSFDLAQRIVGTPG